MSKRRKIKSPAALALTEHWAILPSVFDVIAACASGIEVTADAAEAAGLLFLRPGTDTDKKPAYTVTNGTALVPVRGVLRKAADPVLEYLGFYSTTYGAVKEAFDAALADPKVNRVCMVIDSPGGMVAGAKELCDHIYAARGTKPVIAYADGRMCSAAYWIGSAADAIYAPRTAEIGSIGIIATHVDFSGADEKAGVKYTYLTAGHYKAMGNDSEPLSEEARAYIQDQLDTLYDVFVEGVSRNRSVDADRALAMADGRVFLADRAVEIGLIDAIKTDIAETLGDPRQGGTLMDKKELKEKHPDLYAEVIEEGRATAAADVTAAADQSARTAQMVGELFGPEAADKLTRAIDAGLTPESLKVARDVLAAGGKEQTEAPGAAADDKKQQILDGLEQAHAAADDVKAAADEKKPDFEALVNEYQKQHSCKRSRAIQAVANAHPEAHKAWLEARQAKRA